MNREKCKMCDGSGYIGNVIPCIACDNKGYIITENVIIESKVSDCKHLIHTQICDTRKFEIKVYICEKCEQVFQVKIIRGDIPSDILENFLKCGIEIVRVIWDGKKGEK